MPDAPPAQPVRFADRRDAGQRLAGALRPLALVEPLVLGLPRGGVPVAAEVARALGGALDVLVARKIGLPGQPEYGVGALAEGGEPLLDQRVLAWHGLTPQRLAPVVEAERAELARRVRAYRGGRPAAQVRGRDVVLVDDGLATGVTARAALRALRAGQPRRLVLAVPVAPPDSVRRLADDADDVVCVLQPEDFVAVGRWYDDFAQTEDEEVLALLAAAGRTHTAQG